MCSDTFHAAAALLSGYVKQMECAGKRKKKRTKYTKLRAHGTNTGLLLMVILPCSS